MITSKQRCIVPESMMWPSSSTVRETVIRARRRPTGLRLRRDAAPAVTVAFYATPWYVTVADDERTGPSRAGTRAVTSPMSAEAATFEPTP
ncbi:hypothetical protein GCM10009017_01950 [Halarchaeum rubridurum]|uniref:Uncharacterized protein n=1 Tax=Halarchaeum rubridurum TaxID=489911 RepID=A0A830FSM2_9EURY|nr:hypothetical protein GCM10009017_01950 [Halarchaeum rubridurum]